MHLMILVSLAAATSAAPQIGPYEHVEIPAAPQQFAAPVQQQFVAQQQQFVAQQQFIPQQQQFLPQQQLFAQPQQFAGPVQGVWTGTCLNNLGEGVPCRQKF